MKKRTLVYLTVLITLLLGVYFLFFYNAKTKEEQEKDFAVQDIEILTRIDLKDRNSNTVILTKENEKWTLNGKYDVTSSMLSELLKTINTMEVVSVVPNVAKDNILKEMIGRSTKVSLYKNGNKKPFKIYHVGGANYNQDGTYVLMEIEGKAASTPYIAKVPGRRGFFTYKFTPVENEWRSLAFINLLPQEIKNISVKYVEADKQAASFSINRNKEEYTLTVNGKNYANEQVNQNVAQALFGSFKNLHYESFQENNDQKAYIIEHFPFATINIESVEGKTSTLQTFYMPLADGDRLATIDGVSNRYNIERLFALNTETNLFTTIQIYVFKDILIKGNTLVKQ